GSVRQRPLWRGELDDAERERGHRGEGVERDGRRGIQQGRKTHWQRLIGKGSLAKAHLAAAHDGSSGVSIGFPDRERLPATPNVNIINIRSGQSANSPRIGQALVCRWTAEYSRSLRLY